MVVVGNTGYLILIGSEVHANVIAEVLANAVVPGESNLNTSVLYVTTIDGSRVSTVDGNLLTTDQPVLSGLLIPVECQAQTAVEETSVETEVELLRSFPSQIRIRYDVSISTGVRSTSNSSCHVRSELIAAVVCTA